MRSEFLFLERDTPPSEDEQYEAYREAVSALLGLPLILRTLDIGGDKAVPYLDMPAEENPFLGVRGIRLCLRKPELFLPQLRAIYRASLTGPVTIMFPMIGPDLPYHPLYIFLAIGFGSKMLSWMNDSGFWTVSKLSGFTEKETLQSWTLIVSTISFTGLLLTLIGAVLLPFK